jgi:hypothetical protein
LTVKTSAKPAAAISAMNDTTIRLVDVAIMLFVRPPDRWLIRNIQRFPTKWVSFLGFLPVRSCGLGTQGREGYTLQLEICPINGPIVVRVPLDDAPETGRGA